MEDLESVADAITWVHGKNEDTLADDADPGRVTYMSDRHKVSIIHSIFWHCI